MRLTLTVNGEVREADGVWEGESLLSALRDHLDLPGSKNACEQGECGSCSVYLDGELVCSCLVLAGQAEGRGPLASAALERFGALVAAAAAPIDDVRGSAAYRRHALAVLGRRTLSWAWEEQRCA